MRRPIYLDANIFIKAIEADDAEAHLAWSILQAIAAGELLGLTSELTLAELLPKPMADGAHQLVQAYKGTLRNGAGLTVATVTRSILIRAATVRSKAREIRLPDAIHIATAMENRCAAFLSYDRRIRSSDGLRVLDLTSTALDDLRSLTS